MFYNLYQLPITLLDRAACTRAICRGRHADRPGDEVDLFLQFACPPAVRAMSPRSSSRLMVPRVHHPLSQCKCVVISTILLGTRKMVRIGSIGLALSDTHFCILSKDCFLNLSREYFSLWAIKTSLDRNASALLDQEVLFSRVARHLAFLAFCKLQVGIFFQRSEDIGQCYFLLLQIYCLSSSFEEVFLARHAIFCFGHNSRTHDLMQLLKTSDRKMVTYNIASNLNGIFRRIRKATQ